MKVLKQIIFGLSISCAVPALSAPGEWMPAPKKIASIIVEGSDSGSATILIEGGVPTDYIPSGCNTGGDNIYNTIPLNTDKGKAVYSLALAAYLAGKPVKLALMCVGTRPLITHITF
ncbi:MAG TPA: hypothetical protein VIZ65_05425 [Cellvibrionaceae bacterium]